MERNDFVSVYKPLDWQIPALRDKSPVVLLTGSAGGGKSRTAGEKIHAYCMKYPGATALIVRKARQWNTYSVIPFMWQTVIGKDAKVKFFESGLFKYWNGSVIYTGGMYDDLQRQALRSVGGEGGLDIVWLEEANAFTRDDFQEILGRLRHTAADWQQVILSTNPDTPHHWIYTDLILGGGASVYYSGARNNPHNAPAYLALLERLTGVMRLRLLDGKWVQAEGAVYDEFDPEIHIIDADQCPAFVRRFRVIDFGYNNPFVCQWWGMDADGRLYRYREIYVTKRLVEDMAPEINRLTTNIPMETWEPLSRDQREDLISAVLASNIEKIISILGLEKNEEARKIAEEYTKNIEHIEATIADHDAEDRATLERHGINTIPAQKDVLSGIQAVKEYLKVQDDKRPRIYLVRNALVDRDPLLESEKKPTCTEEELPGYAWEKSADGKPIKERPLKINDHGADGMRYMVYTLTKAPTWLFM